MKPVRLAALLALVPLAASCSGGASSKSPVGGDDDDAAFKLNNGHYAFVIDQVPSDSCWAPPKTLPEVPMTITGTITVQGNQVTFVTDASGQIPSQTLTLTKTDNDLSGGGSGPVDLNSQGINCVLDVVGDFDGVMTAEDEFDGSITIDVQQQSGDCSILVGDFLNEQLSALPCSMTLQGSAAKG